MQANNNFDFLRLVFASFVIITHAYPLTGKIECDYLCQITNAQLSFSYLGVRGFFIISGYLIYKSLLRSQTLVSFYWKRFLRIFPALVVVLVLSFLLAFFVYTDPTVPYFKNRTAWLYVPLNLMIFKDYFSINGVFQTNPYPDKINGSLWTIRYEVFFYLLLSALYFFKNKVLFHRVVLTLSFLLFAFSSIYFEPQLSQYKFIFNANYIVELGAFFLGGSLLGAINIELWFKKKYLVLGLFVLLFISIYFNFFNVSKYLLLPIFIVSLALNRSPLLIKITNYTGDLSYGIYLYAFPVQQTLAYYFELNPLYMVLLTLPIVFLLAFISWNLIEKIALRYKSSVTTN